MAIALAICCAWSITSTTHSPTHIGAFSLPAVTTTKIGDNNIISSSNNDGNRIRIRQTTRISSLNSDDADANGNANEYASVWSPDLRRVMAGIAGVGALETGYLTYAKLFSDATTNGALLFCGSSSNSYSSCDRVLNGPYSNLPFFESIPLASLGFLAYSSVVVLALLPLFGGNDGTTDDTNDGGGDTSNRIVLTALTTSMATFSIFLMTLLFGVLQTSCPYCVVSAACSFLLANIALIGGCLPERTEIETSASTTAAANGGKTVFAGFAGGVVGAVLLFGAGSIDSINNNFGSSTSTLVATINGQSTSSSPEKVMLYAPPAITTDSSERALALGRELHALGGARMYGAHWCSHCYDQKQTLGKQVFGSDGNGFVEYVECSNDGVRSQSKVCKAKEIPGYPTWEIQGKLYPGEQELDELEDLVKGLKEGSTTTTK